jgi:hypothetical protein
MSMRLGSRAIDLAERTGADEANTIVWKLRDCIADLREDVGIMAPFVATIRKRSEIGLSRGDPNRANIRHEKPFSHVSVDPRMRPDDGDRSLVAAQDGVEVAIPVEQSVDLVMTESVGAQGPRMQQDRAERG